jgi:hypothetical protein
MKRMMLSKMIGKNDQKNQSSAEQIDHPSGGIQNSLLQSHFKLQSEQLTTRSETPPRGGQLRRFVQRVSGFILQVSVWPPVP